MATGEAAKYAEMAIIELEYLSADTLFYAEGQSAEEKSRSVASYYRTACIALHVCLYFIEQAEAQENNDRSAA